MSSHSDFILANARVVLADAVIERGWVAVAEGRIAEIGEGRTPGPAEDLAGDLLIPGLVELHTDHIEAHYVPRPKVHWDPMAAVVSYDAQLATSGITTVLDSVRIWREAGIQEVDGQHDVLSDAIARACDADLLRADHFLHLRCEVPMPDIIADTEKMIGRREVRLMSLMDHTPGQRQFRDEAKLRVYYRGKKGGLTDPELDEMFALRRRYQETHAGPNRRALVEMARRHGIPLASHDDTVPEHVSESITDQVAIAEFPTTAEAATGLHAAGIKVLMGAPNLVRGGSHSGNVATADLAAAGVLDIMSSDYVPSALLLGALRLPEAVPQFDLPAAIRTVSRTPAHAVGLTDRGEIAVGKRADLVRVYSRAGASTARMVWREGRRVA
jgi:alpha-D-ribose 1-methylphosphonate 5-triphosphate diphosphatase